MEELKAVRKEIETSILKKVDAIKNKVLTSPVKDEYANVQMLAIINDELDDVLLNWDPSYLDSGFGNG